MVGSFSSAHIFFDDAFKAQLHGDNGYQQHVNDFVRVLVGRIDKAARYKSKVLIVFTTFSIIDHQVRKIKDFESSNRHHKKANNTVFKLHT